MLFLSALLGVWVHVVLVCVVVCVYMCYECVFVGIHVCYETCVEVRKQFCSAV